GQRVIVPTPANDPLPDILVESGPQRPEPSTQPPAPDNPTPVDVPQPSGSPNINTPVARGIRDEVRTDPNPTVAESRLQSPPRTPAREEGPGAAAGVWCSDRLRRRRGNRPDCTGQLVRPPRRAAIPRGQPVAGRRVDPPRDGRAPPETRGV